MLGKSSSNDFVGAELQTIKRADKKTQKRQKKFTESIIFVSFPASGASKNQLS